ncbi:hypothetical protein FJZ48_02700 [Candidatus Uhrbacteria bacterium]|nr:hypothetical protein [Candidatus Uhrbacteria bacterium]
MQEAWSIVMVQKRTREIQSPDHLMVCSGYAESGKHGMVDQETYQRVTDAFIFGKSQHEPFDREEFLSVQRTPALRELLDQCDKDEECRKTLKELIEKIIMYVQDTDEILDLAGKDNLILYQKNGTWKYQFVDALFPKANGLGESRRALARASRGEGLSQEDRDMLLNGVNFVRTINGLAAYLGVPDRLSLRSPRFVPGRVNVLSTLQIAA